MCLVLGCVWLVTQGQPAPELAQVAWDESVAEQQVAQAGKRLATASMPESAPSSAVAKPEEKESLEDLDVMVKAKGVDRKKADRGRRRGPRDAVLQTAAKRRLRLMSRPPPCWQRRPRSSKIPMPNATECNWNSGSRSVAKPGPVRKR